MPPLICDRLRERCDADARRSLRLAAELLRLLDLLGARGVAAVPFKGPVLAATLYGDLALRPFRDLDLLVSRADLPAAGDVVRALGYRVRLNFTQAQETAFLDSQCEQAFVRQDGEIVELHWDLFLRSFALSLDVEQLRNRLQTECLGGREVRTFAPEDLLLVLGAHGAWHVWERLAWICDVAELLRQRPALDWDAVTARAQAAGATRMLWLSLVLASDLLGAPVPSGLRNEAQADRAVRSLASSIGDRLFAAPISPPGAWRRLRVSVRARERWQDRWRVAYRTLTTPGPGDWSLVWLPTAFYWLYYLIRPIRLFLKYGPLARR